MDEGGLKVKVGGGVGGRGELEEEGVWGVEVEEAKDAEIGGG